MELFFGSFQSAGRKSKSCQHILDILPAEYVAIYYIISIYIFIYTCTFGLVTRFCQQNIVLSHVKLSPWSTSFLGPMELFLVGLILPAEYPNSAGRILRFCRQNISSLYKSALLPAQSYFGRILIVCQQNLSSISYLYALLGVVTHFCQQNIVVSHVIYLHIYKSALLGLQLDSASKIFTFCWQNHILEVS